MTTDLSLCNERLITIIGFESKGLGIEPVKDSLSAFFPCLVSWCDPDIDPHIAVLDDELNRQDTISILARTHSELVPGQYRKVTRKCCKENPVIFFVKTSN